MDQRVAEEHGNDEKVQMRGLGGIPVESKTGDEGTVVSRRIAVR